MHLPSASALPRFVYTIYALLVFAMSFASARTLRIDFGPNDGTNGNVTTSPDANGHHWNNIATGHVVPADLVVPDLRTIDDEPTGIGVRIASTTWRTNGILNGGLLAPSAALLGEFAIATATQDYFFIEGASATAVLEITGLNATRLYDLRLFGSRNTTDVRRTLYTATGSNGQKSTPLQTSGPGIGTGGYDGNNDTTVVLEDVQPNAAGTIQLRMSVAEGTFAYLGLLEITEGDTPVPLPTVTDVIGRWVAQDRAAPVDPASILFVGSSSIRRWEPLARDFSDYRILQRGFGGAHLSNVNAEAPSIVLPYSPRAIVMWAGTNDIRGGKSAATVLGDFRTFVDLVHAQHPDAHIFYLSVTPTPDSAFVDATRRQLNQLIAAECAGDSTLHFIDLASFFENLQATDPARFQSLYVDGLHLSKAGYEEWRKIVRPAIEAVFAPDKPAAANPAPLAAGERLLFDFGPSDTTNGDQTLGPDTNGHRWNNWHGTNGGGLVNSGERVTDLVDTTGRVTGLRITITGGFLCNGKLNGGLFNPSPALLGDLAIQTATQDYFYSTGDDKWGAGDDDVPAGFMLDGLDPALSYTFRFFGSRDATETRITEFDVRGANRRVVTLRTSGAGIGTGGTNANNDTVAIASGIRPDAFGQVFVDMTLLQGTFAYLNAMEVVATAPSEGIAGWREFWFSDAELADASLETTLWGDAADPDGDGRPNLAEYAVETNPRASDADPTAWSVESTPEGDVLTLLYRTNPAATEVTAVVDRSETFETWTPVASALVSTIGTLEIRKASALMDGFPRRFLRLRYLPAAPAAAASAQAAIDTTRTPAAKPGIRTKRSGKRTSTLRGRTSRLPSGTVAIQAGRARLARIAPGPTWRIDLPRVRGRNRIAVRYLDAQGHTLALERRKIRR